MAGLLLIIVIAAVVQINNALPSSIVPYNTPSPPLSLSPYRFSTLGNFSISPKKPGFSMQPKPGFSIQPKDTVAMKSRPLRYHKRNNIELPCTKKTQVAHVYPGDSVTFYSQNYPYNYAKRAKCSWKILGRTASTVFRITCIAFKLQPQTRKGKCGDYLDIQGLRYCGNQSPTYSSLTDRVKMKFKSNGKKQYPGFKCVAEAVDENVSTTVAPTTSTPIVTTHAPVTTQAPVTTHAPVTTNAPVTTHAPVSTVEPSECSCGRVNRETKIVGGVATEVNEYPWMVALAFSSYSSSAFCGGSIIHESFVLTAAHCVAIMDGSEVVVVGEHQWSSSSESTVRETVTISEIISHENYNPSTMNNDVALLRLSSPLTFRSDNKVAPICPPVAGNLYAHINAIVTGWGTTSSGGTLSDTLLEVTVPTMINSDCQDNYEKYGSDEITDEMLCAGLPEGGKDSCQGDSGGPLITQDSSIYRQIGVVSWGYGCAYAGFPGVYARITSQLNWISSKMAGYNWCSPGGTNVTPTPTEPPVTTVPTDIPVTTVPVTTVPVTTVPVTPVPTEPPVTTVPTIPPVTTTPTMPPTSDCNCGRVNRVPRIVGGVEAEVNEYPWMVALASSTSSSSAFCGGSIIDEEYVLTAAHCAAIMDGSEVVVVGEHNWDSDTESSVREIYNIAQIKTHPNFNSKTLQNDVALLKLAQPLTFGNDNKIAPICPPEAGNLYSNIDVTVTGWGTTSSGGPVSDILLEVIVPTMTNSDCQDNYANYGSAEITDEMICAGLPEGGKDSCQGDSGGPMITQDSYFYRQIGVVSWGYGCAYAGLPGVYARITSQLYWISSQMPGSIWCSPGGTNVTPTPTEPPVTGVPTVTTVPTEPPTTTMEPPVTTVPTEPPTTTMEPPVTTVPTEPPTSDCKCGRVNRVPRIVNGQETEVLEYPWQAGIISYDTERTWCGGSLINSKWVMTATHCTEGLEPSRIQVLLGEHTIYTTDDDEQRFDVSQIINHPNYVNNPWSNGHDISLVELEGEVDFSSTLIRPICLPSTQDLFAGAQATVTGFGRTSPSSDQSLVLMEVDITVVTNDECKNTFGASSITNTMICAGDGDGSGACMGDSGGPLITSVGDYHVQIGVVSFGSSYCDALGVYARVTELQSWVEGHAMTGDAKVCTP